MSGEVTVESPPVTPFENQSNLTSPITILPSANHTGDMTITEPTVPLHRQLENNSVHKSLQRLSTTPCNVPNGNVSNKRRDTRPNSLPHDTKPIPRRHHDRLGRHRTISGVTEEARKVLEQFLVRSLIQEDEILSEDNQSLKVSDLTVPVRPVRGSSMPESRTLNLREGVDDDIPDCPPPPVPKHQLASRHSNSPSRPNMVAQNLRDANVSNALQSHQQNVGGAVGGAECGTAAAIGAASHRYQLSLRDSVVMPDDDATSHSPVSCPNSLYSFSSRSSSHPNRIQIDRSIRDEKELMRAAEQQQRKRKSKKKSVRDRRLARQGSKDSSSSSEYEIVNGQLQLRRKKSLFKRAQERIRASFRRKKDSQPFDPYRIDDEEILEAQGQSQKTPEKRGFNILSPRRTKSSAERSPISDRDAGISLRRHQSQGNPEGSRWAVLRERQNTDKEKKSFFDNLLRSLRKSGDKLGIKRKSSTRGASVDLPARSRSADQIHHYSVNRNNAGHYPDHLLRHSQTRVTTSHTQTSSYYSQTCQQVEYCRCHSVDSSQHISHQQNFEQHQQYFHDHAQSQTVTQEHSALHAQGCNCYTSGNRSHLHLEGITPHTLPPDDGHHRVHSFGLPSTENRLHPHDGPISSSGLLPSPNRPLPHQEGVERLSYGHSVQNHLTVTTNLDRQRSLRSSSAERSGQDDIDGIVPETQEVHKPFAEKTDAEKDELYEKIAAQLASIADNYNLGSPRSLKDADIFFSGFPLGGSTIPKSASAPAAATVSSGLVPNITTSPPTPREVSEPKVEATESADTETSLGATGGALQPEEATGRSRTPRTPIEQKIGKILRDKGDKAAIDMSELEPVVRELVRNASYSHFQQVIHENIGSEPSWQQVALLFNLTRSAVRIAGLGTAAALQIKESTLKYFEDRFAGWIIGQGGWESMVDDTDLSSEVD